MVTKLTEAQRSVAWERIHEEFLSKEMGEVWWRASLATAENKREATGIPELFCAMYLQFGDEFARYWSGDLETFLHQVFPKHRRGHLGMVPEQELARYDSDDISCETGVGWQIKLSDELIGMLWEAARLARCIGKTTSMMDVIAALSSRDQLPLSIREAGIAARVSVGSLESEIGGIIFSSVFHASPEWKSQQQFELGGDYEPPFTLEVLNPHSRFRPARGGQVHLNGEVVAELSETIAHLEVNVKLLPTNLLAVVLPQSRFSGVRVIVRGKRPTAK
jgi:hypothetical protein